MEDRLTRLETKAFGAPTTIQDLSERTDRLEEYVASKNPSGGSRYPSQGSDDDQQQLPPIGSASAPPAAINLGQTVSTMEIKVFGKTETGSLVKRIGHLEKSVYKDKKETDGPFRTGNKARCGFADERAVLFRLWRTTGSRQQLLADLRPDT